jgi:hypothetical protein
MMMGVKVTETTSGESVWLQIKEDLCQHSMVIDKYWQYILN